RRLEASQEFLAVTPGDEGRSAGVRIRLNRPGETEVGQAGEPPGGGIIRWAPRVEEVGSARFRSSEIHAPVSHPVLWTSSNERPLCLENSRRAAAELCRYENSSALHFRLNQDSVSSPATNPAATNPASTKESCFQKQRISIFYNTTQRTC